ncbi:MAG: hypothetical protein RLZZ32_1779 [Cyanobacteriota bacterium]|jgi:hypothetical protein
MERELSLADAVAILSGDPPRAAANGAGRVPADRKQPPKGKTGKRTLGFSKAMRCLDRCVEVVSRRERNSMRRRAILLRAMRALGLHREINRQELAQRVLEAKDRQLGNEFQLLTAADRAAMPQPVVRWLIPSLLPATDLTILGGRPKVGKTRLAVAICAAVARGEGFMGFPAPQGPQPVVLVTDDQADGDSAEMMDNLGLWTHPQLTWSRHFRLTERDVDRLLEAITANPGCLVVIDSLRSISRSLQFGENDPEIGATLYDLKQAVIEAGGTLLLIHHCNKAADLVGVEALSGHGAISGAANTVLTMHYLAGDKGQPNKSAPERRLVREGRSGTGFDLVLTREANGFRVVADMDVWQQQAKEAQELEKLSPLQLDVLHQLEDAGGGWMTRRQVCEALDIEWTARGKSGPPRRVEDALTRLVQLGKVERVRSGTEATYRFSA